MKNTFVSVLFVFAMITSFAQKAKFGVKGGLNIANLNIDGDENAPALNSIIGYNIGAFVEVKLSKTIALQPEVLYSTQGAKFSLDVPTELEIINADASFNLDYITVPVMLKYFAAESFCLEFGPQVSFITGADLTVKAKGRSASESISKLFTSNDFGLNLGLSYNFSPSVFLQGRYNFGLTNIAKTESGDDSTIKNSVLSFSLGYKFK